MSRRALWGRMESPGGAVNAGLLGVAVVGLGVGERHARVYRAEGGCRLLWLCDLDRDKARATAAALGQGRPTTDFSRILADPEVDVVSIATYDAQHFGQAVAALEAGKHVFVEKPVCRTLAEARLLLAAWKASGTPPRALGCNLVLRAAPLYRRLRRAVRQGELGRIYALDGEYLYGRLEKILTGWRGREDDYSVMAGGGVHMIDLALWITGERPESVFALGNRICTRDSVFRYDDFVTASALMSGGAVARFTANFGCVHRHQHVLRLYGTQGSFLYDDSGARLHASRDPRTPPVAWQDDPVPADRGESLSRFLLGIRQGRDWARDVHSYLDVIAVCAAVEKSHAERQPIQVDYA
ncbi:hypothetical protein JCM15519_27960 [Fundidesulfovibrio butyratiphilus]